MGENLEINIKMDVDNDRLVIKISETPSGVRKSAEIKLSEISLMQKGITINAVCCDSTKKISN